MPGGHPDQELRGAVARAVGELRNRGWTHAAIAREVGVHRSAPAGWQTATRTPNATTRRDLARRWPDLFGRTALGETWLGMLDLETKDTETVGLEVHLGVAELYRVTADAILQDPVPLSDRVIRHIGLHVDVPGGDALVTDRHYGAELQHENQRFRNALRKRAGDQWDIRTVVTTGDVERLDGMFRHMTDELDGPRVHVRAYASSVPLVVNPILIANRDVILAFDDLRYGKPSHGLLMRGKRVVGWVQEYFDTLFENAPYQLRNKQGLQESEFARLRSDLTS